MEASNDQIKSFLKEPGTFAIVGASTKSHKAGNYVPKFLQDHGWNIIPVNPFADEIVGEPTIDSLDDLDQEVQGVIIYRNAEAAVDHVKKAINQGIEWIWLPEGVTSEEAKQLAEDRHYVEDKCPKQLITTWKEEGTW